MFGFEPANGYRDFETKCSLHKLFTKSWMQRCFVWIRTHDTHIAAEKSIIRNKCFPRLFGSEPPKNKYCALWHCTNRIGKVEHQCRHRQSKRACYEISSSNRRIRRQPEMAAAPVCRKTPIKREPKWAFWNISEKKMRKMQRRGRDGYLSTFFLRIF